MPYIGKAPSSGIRSRFIYTATAGQTTFTGADDNNKTLGYTDSEYVDVYLNGVLLEPADYTATSKTSVVLDSGATVGDTMEIVVYDTFSVFNGTFSGDLTVDGTTLHVDSTNNRVGVGTDSPDTIAEIRGANPIVTIRDTETSSGSAEATLRLAETGASDSLGSYWDIKSSGGKLEFIDNWDEGGGTGTRVTIDDAGNVGIGATPNSYTGFTTLTLGGSGSSDLDFEKNGTVIASLYTSSGNDRFFIQSVQDSMVFQTAGSNDRMTINSSGDVIIGATSGSGTRLTVKSDSENLQYIARFWHDGNNSNYRGIEILSGTDDGSGTNAHIDFRDGDGSFVGRISSTSGTVTYGPFTAMHPCILPDADNDTGYPYGTLLEITSLAYTQKNGENTERGLIYNVRKTQSANSKAVLGAYGSSENADEEFTNRHQVLVLGDGHILCNNSGGNISMGDGICSSAAAGIGQKATANPSMIIGIAQEDVTFADDTETKLVAVQYGLQQFIPWS